jgi:hypothetical protein
MAWNPTKFALVCAACGGTVPTPKLGPAPRHTFNPQNVPNTTIGNDISYTCTSCGAPANISAADISGRCHFCSAPWVLTSAHGASPLPDGIIPVSIDVDTAQKAFEKWVKSRWLAPNAFKSREESPSISIVYQPVWAFYTQTASEYEGDRGVQYTRGGSVHWSPTNGSITRYFAGVAVSGTVRHALTETWDYSKALHYDDACLVGATAHASGITLNQAWSIAMATINAQINVAIDHEIGGDEQRITSLHTQFGPTSGSYLLAPSWSGDYLFNSKSYSVDVNAETAVVSGERPYSTIKVTAVTIAMLLLAAAVLIFIVMLRLSRRAV